MDVLDLFATISLDPREYNQGLSEASGKTSSFGDAVSGVFGNISKIGAAAMKATAAATAAATTAVSALAKASLDGYANYEQLVGGVETLFDTSADVVMEYANNAYQTAGLSANEYMETVTSFSASLLQSLGGDTEAAAHVADMAITDMADNANKMGTSMESIQNAYQGFAKQNYTMLDNLKLGYGGTKEEMQRLLSDAEKLSGVKYDISSYADIVDAIHVVQTEMGITGTTAAEAASTIQGSVSAMKSAWQNLVTGVADGNADLDQLIGNFVDSVKTAGSNILPRVEQIMSGIGIAVEKIAPIVADELPALVTSVLPSMVGAGGQLLTGLLTGIISALPSLAGAVPQIVGELGASLSDNWPAIKASGGQLLDMLVGGLSGNLPALIPAGVGAVMEFADSITAPENLSALADGAIAITSGLADGIINSIGILFEKGPEIVQNIADGVRENAPKIWDAAATIVDELGNALAEQIPGLSVVFENLETVVAAVTAAFVAFKAATSIAGVIDTLRKATESQTIAQAALNAIMNANPFVLVATLIAGVTAALVTLYNTNEDFRNFVNEAWTSVKETISDAVSNIVTFFTETVPNAAQEAVDWFNSIPDKMKEIGRNLLIGLWDGIMDRVNWLKEKVGGVVDAVKGWFTGKDGFDEHSPSKWAFGVGDHIMVGLGNGTESGAKTAAASARTAVSKVKDVFESDELSDASDHLGHRIMASMAGGVEKGSESVMEAVEDVVKEVKSRLDDFIGDVEHALFLAEKNGADSMNDTISAYRLMQENIHKAAEYYRSLGYSETSDEIQQLQKMWWGYADNIKSVYDSILKNIKSAFDEVSNIMGLRSDVGNLEYQLWERTEGLFASDADKYSKKLDMLTGQQEDQEAVVEAATAAYEAVVEQYGEASAESYEYQRALLQEKLALQDIIDEIKKVNQARSQAMGSAWDGTAEGLKYLRGEEFLNSSREYHKQQIDELRKSSSIYQVPFNESAIGASTAATVNALSSAGDSPHEINLYATMMAPDGTKFASWMAKPLTDYMDANGTPILNKR